MAQDTQTGARSPLEDDVLRQLKKLREGAGLTLDRLRASGGVMSALSSGEPAEARDRLLDVLGEMQGDRVAALQVDLGIGLEDHLERPPTSRELSRLGERRAAYGAVVNRDPKTLARWSDQAITELRGRLLDDTYTGDLYVVGSVRGNRILGVSLVREVERAPSAVTDEPDAITTRESVDYKNSSKKPSLPCLLYAFPRDWQPKTLTLAATFLDGDVPKSAWGFHVLNFLEVPFAPKRYALQIRDGSVMCRFINPRRDRIYGLWWGLAPDLATTEEADSTTGPAADHLRSTDERQ